MAFHVACPITSRRICFCSLGFPRELQSEKARDDFLANVARIHECRNEPSLLGIRGKGTVQVLVPKVVAPAAAVAGPGDGGRVGDDGEDMSSAQTKRAALQRKAAAASLAAEDYARQSESGALVDASANNPGEDQGQANIKVMCRLCYVGENEGSERARKMLPCKNCGKKYHRSCLKAWSQHRDLFHWSSWTCPSCRVCEVCRRSGDQTRFMFCKRCDGAYHCYCQQPPHKNVSSGPYLCPKHTRCHSCGSTVPGNGPSTRWFLNYTCCDACGRLFVKGNYCPICLKVYRDSESTPMVCCDICQSWVHCQCDGISDEKYLQFQVDGNLQYKCATCRGECHRVRDIGDAIQELWRRRDEDDRDLIASLREAAKLPTQEDIFSVSPYSDDEDSGPNILRSEFGRSLKFSLKGVVDKSPRKTKEYGNKYSTKQYGKKERHSSLVRKSELHQSFEGLNGRPSIGDSRVGDKNDDLQVHGWVEPFPSTAAGSLSEGICSINQAGVTKHKFIDEDTVGTENLKSRVVQIKNSNPHSSGNGDDTGIVASQSKTTNTKGRKLVIHLGGRNRNVTSSPGSDASSYQKEQEWTNSYGTEDGGQEQTVNRLAKSGDAAGNKVGKGDQLKGPKFQVKEGNFIKIRKLTSDMPLLNPKFGGRNPADRDESLSPVNTHLPTAKKHVEESAAEVETAAEVPARRSDKLFLRKNLDGRVDGSSNVNNDSTCTPFSDSPPRNSKPLLKLKFKNPYQENQSSWAPQIEDEKFSVKGQRSKRRRPSMEKTSREDGDASDEDNTMNEIMDASWVLQKLGKDSVGKRVEVQQPSDSTWHKGTVKDFIESPSSVSLALDDGRAKMLELGKEPIRFVYKKQKH